MAALAVPQDATFRDLLSRFTAKVVDPVDGEVSTAFFIDRTGRLLTCWHVMEPDFAGIIRNFVFIEYGGYRYRARFVRKLSNRNKDIAVLQLYKPDFKLLQRRGFEVARLAFPVRPADPTVSLGYQRQDRLGDPLLLRSFIDPENMWIGVKDWINQRCLATVFRHAHNDLGMSGAALLKTQTAHVVGIVAGVLPSSHSHAQPLGFSVPLTDVQINWPTFAADCDVLNYDPIIDDRIVPQDTEFDRHGAFSARPLWETRIQTFLNDPDPRRRYLLLIGGEGAGKSALMAHCIRTQVEPVYHFIRRGQSRWESPDSLLLSLDAQLRRKYSIEANAELEENLAKARSIKERAQAAATILENTLARASGPIAAAGGKEVLWIDGLDEAFGPNSHFHDIAGLPGLLPPHLPPGIRAVLTSRPGDHLHWLRKPDLCEQYRLEDDCADNVDDVERYIRANAAGIRPPLEDDFIRHFAQRTQGNFYITVRKLEEIRREPDKRRDPETFPATVREYHAEVYQRVVQRAGKSGISEPDVRFVFGVLGEACEPLAPVHFEVFGLPDWTEQLLGWAADHFHPRPAGRCPDLPYAFNHLSVQDFFQSQLSHAEKRKIHRILAAACSAWRDWKGPPRGYALRWLPYHCSEATNHDQLAEVLLDLEFLEERLKR